MTKSIAKEYKKLERKLIIKVLKEHGKSEWCGEPDCPRPFPTEHLIALIEVENK
jgi:hypothetical protein